LPAIQLLSSSFSSEDLVFAAAHSSVEVVSFLLQNHLSTMQYPNSTIYYMLEAAMEAHNTPVVDWVVQCYADKYPGIFGSDNLHNIARRTNTSSILQKYRQIMLQSNDQDTIQDYFIQAIERQEQTTASFLFDRIVDNYNTSFVAGARRRLFKA